MNVASLQINHSGACVVVLFAMTNRSDYWKLNTRTNNGVRTDEAGVTFIFFTTDEKG